MRSRPGAVARDLGRLAGDAAPRGAARGGAGGAAAGVAANVGVCVLRFLFWCLAVSLAVLVMISDADMIGHCGKCGCDELPIVLNGVK